MLINTQLSGRGARLYALGTRGYEWQVRSQSRVLARACCKILPGKHSIWLVGGRNKFEFMEVKQSPAEGGKRFPLLLTHFSCNRHTTWAQRKFGRAWDTQ
jgi:hypothetical protein